MKKKNPADVGISILEGFSRPDLTHKELFSEYYQLSVRSDLSRTDEERMDEILAIAEEENEFAELLRKVDKLVHQKLGVEASQDDCQAQIDIAISLINMELYESELSRAEEKDAQADNSPRFISKSKDTNLVKSVNAKNAWQPQIILEELASEYYLLSIQSELSEADKDRIDEILTLAEEENEFAEWLREVDKLVFQKVGAEVSQDACKVQIDKATKLLEENSQQTDIIEDHNEIITGRSGADDLSKASQEHDRRLNNRQIRRLVETMDTYANNDRLYVPIQRQMHLLSNEVVEEGKSFGDCFKDYFFIYESAAITHDMPLHHRKSIQLQRQKKAQQLNQQLNKYWQACRQGTYEQALNPTRLDHAQLKDAIYAFHPQRKGSYRHQAKIFEAGVTNCWTTRDFVEPFYNYIMEPLIQVNDQYQASRFSKIIKDALLDVAGKSKTPLTGISINQMCTRLLKLLVSNTVERPEMMHFKRLVENAGAKAITAVLLKIVLYRRTIRSWFEDRFGTLFHAQESSTLDKVFWLVESFEYMNVALALNAPWVNYIPRSMA